MTVAKPLSSVAYTIVAEWFLERSRAAFDAQTALLVKPISTMTREEYVAYAYAGTVLATINAEWGEFLRAFDPKSALDPVAAVLDAPAYQGYGGAT